MTNAHAYNKITNEYYSYSVSSLSNKKPSCRYRIADRTASQ